jgi:hypothetical protein
LAALSSWLAYGISVAGAKLNVGSAPAPGTHVFLLLDDYGAITARIAWRRNSRLGLKFLCSSSGAAGARQRAATRE